MTEATKGLGGQPAEADARRQRRQLRAEYAIGRLTLEELEEALAELDSRNGPAEQEDTDDDTDR